MPGWLHYARRTFPRLVGFGLAGLPAFLLAVPLNYALVKWIGISKPAAYACVLVFQVSINFCLCRRFVFKADANAPLGKTFARFLSGLLAFRALDWALYWFLTSKCGLPFIGVQLFNVGLFSLLKFEFARHVFEAGEPKGPS